MIIIRNAVIADIKRNCQKTRNFISMGLFALAALGFIYSIYWCLAIGGSEFVKETHFYFEGVASIFYPNLHSNVLYQQTSLLMFKLMIPCVSLYYVIDKIEQFIISQIKKYNKAVIEYRERKAQKRQQKEKENPKKYSICLSVDYISQKEVSEITKAALNKYVFKRIAKKLNSLTKGLEIDDSTNVLVVASDDFKHYDYVYDNILAELAKLEKVSKRKYEIEFIPNLTTDAVEMDESVETIKKNHVEIKGFNLPNTALATAEFLKKYKNLKKEKYKATPIGQYTSWSKPEKETYELSVIYKNLNNTLASL